MKPNPANGPEVMLSLGAIRVLDMSRSVEFYTRGCGFVLEREFATATFVASILRAGPAGIELISPAGAGGEPVDHGNMLQKFVLNTADPAAVMSRACRFGGTEILPATHHPGHGMTIGVLADPDGYRLEFVGRTSTSTSASESAAGPQGTARQMRPE